MCSINTSTCLESPKPVMSFSVDTESVQTRNFAVKYVYVKHCKRNLYKACFDPTLDDVMKHSEVYESTIVTRGRRLLQGIKMEV